MCISEKVVYVYLRYVYYYPSSGASSLLVFIIDGLLMGKKSISDTSVMKFAYFSTAWSSIPSKHQGREIYTTYQQYPPFSPPSEPLSYFKAHPSYPFSNTI